MATSEGPVQKRLKGDFGNTITVFAGPEKTKFIVHEEFIETRSGFFDKACSGAFKEASEKVVRLPSIDSDVFKAYLRWVYSDTDNVFVPEPSDTTEQSDKADPFYDLAKLYIAGEYLDDMELRNAVIDKIIDTSVESRICPNLRTIETAFTTTLESSTLCSVFVDCFICWDDLESFEKNGRAMPPAFLYLLSLRSMKTAAGHVGVKPDNNSRHLYHEDKSSLPDCPKSPKVNKKARRKGRNA